ncbi:MAG: S9 family peptidase [Hyphomicrobiaceae bacterium]
MARRPIPYGHWPSPIAAKDVAVGARRFGMLQGDGPWVYWTEGRPEEKGRQALMRAKPGARSKPQELLAAPWSARSRVHEYGGGEFLVTGGRIFFVNDGDQDVYEVVAGQAPQRITNEPTLRFADVCLDAARGRLIAVAERHTKGKANPDNLIVAIALHGSRAGAVTPLCEGRDFYAAPRLSPDGAQLAFVTWDLPGMPWDEAELCVAELDGEGRPRKLQSIAGGQGVAISHPQWAPDGRLIYISDASGFGALMAYDGAKSRSLSREKLEFGRPPWVFGAYPYTIDAAGTVWAAPIAADRSGGGGCKLLEVDRAGKDATWHTLNDSGLDYLVAFDGGIAGIATQAAAPSMLTSYSFATTPRIQRHRASSDLKLAESDIAVSQLVHFTGGDGQRTFALYYPPTNRRVEKDPDALPPALILAHGGPTASASRALSPRIQFYTSRGFAVLDVDYAGSTGYGRKYRQRLEGQWGSADVADCAAGARFLARKGFADAKRIAIAGGSAGGYTVLMALATTDVFAAGSSHYGISDLSLLMEHTHKFESGYLHRLLGTTPKAWKKVCRERSPIQHVKAITAPVILFQGLEDKVVPPEQSRLIHDGLKARGIASALHEFAGEGHGFRRAETIIAVLDAELAFLLRTL